METFGKRFDWADFIKRIAVIAIPVALQNLLSTTGTMVDTMMIAPLGENTVGAVGLCAQFATLILAGYWGFVGGGILFISQYWGAQDEDGVSRSYGMILVCMLTVGFVSSFLALARPDLIMRLYTDKKVIQDIGIRYLKVVGFAYPLQIFSIAASTLLRSTERVRIPLYASIASVLSNIFLNWVFIYGHLGCPALGVQGAALATVCAACVNVAFILICAAAVKYPFLFRVRALFRWTKASTRLFFRRCFPIICNEVFIGIGNMTVNVVLGRQGESTIAALAVFRTLEGLIIGFFSGFASASSVLVGKDVGAGELDEAYERARRLVPLCMASILMVGLLLNAVKPAILHAMGLSGASFDTCRYLVLVFSFVAVIRMGNWVMNDTYRASGDAVTGTVLEIVFMYVMVMPVVCIAGLKLRVDIRLLFPLIYCDEIIRWVIMQVHLYSGRWIRPVTETGLARLPAFRAARASAHGSRRRSG